MEDGLRLDVVVGEGAAVLELPAREDQALLVGRDVHLVKDLGLDAVDRLRRLDLEGDCPAGERLDKDRHTPMPHQLCAEDDEGVRHLHKGRSIGGALGPHALHQCPQRVGALAWALQPLAAAHSLSHGLSRGDEGKWHLAVGEQLPRRHAKCPHVRLFGEATALERLGRHPSEGYRLALHEAKISDLDHGGRRIVGFKGEHKDVSNR